MVYGDPTSAANAVKLNASLRCNLLQLNFHSPIYMHGIWERWYISPSACVLFISLPFICEKQCRGSFPPARLIGQWIGPRWLRQRVVGWKVQQRLAMQPTPLLSELIYRVYCTKLIHNVKCYHFKRIFLKKKWCTLVNDFFWNLEHSVVFIYTVKHLSSLSAATAPCTIFVCE